MRRENARHAGVTRSSRVALVLALALSSAVARAGEHARATHYHVDATLEPEARAIHGTVDVRVENGTRTPLDEVVLVLYPNRFARPDPGIDDLNRPYVYPREAFDAGAIAIERVEVRGGDTPPLPAVAVEQGAIDGWPDTRLRVRLPEALPPGGVATVRATFRTVLPERYGPFGVVDGDVAALGGWYPLLAARTANGGWDVVPEGRRAAIDGVLHAPASATLVVGRRVVTAGEAAAVAIDAGEEGGPVVLASEGYRVHRHVADGTSVVFLELPGRHSRVFPPWRAPHATVVLDALERILRARPAGLAAAQDPLIVAEARLRLDLIAPSRAGIAVVSDRILRTDRVLRDFHERALAAAVYAALVRETVAARERPEDVAWITEGVAAALADRYLARERPQHRTVYDWIRLFNVFAIVDRFESAPKIPFARAFFPEARHADELRDGLESFARDRPPGGTIFTKLRNEVGDAVFAATVDAYLAGAAPLRAVAAERAGRPLDWLFEQWTAPYPEPLNYALRDVETNERMETAGGAPAVPSPGGATTAPTARDETLATETAFRHRVVVARDSSRPIREPVDIEVQGSGERRARFVWDDDAKQAELVVTTPWRARRVTLDPDRRLLEDTRVDDSRPRPLQVVLDSADVTVTSSEFGISGLFVARPRYDYRKDVGAVAFYSDRSIGFTVGPRVHFGAANDPTSYRHNIYGFYTFAGLRRSFHDESRPELRTDGNLGGVGVRYDYTDEFFYDNPTRTTKLRLFADLYDRRLGSSFDYAAFGVRASVVRPILTPRTLVAVQALNAFSSPTGSDHVPNQGRYSLGGDLAIRGIPVEKRLGENIALARFELRQMLYPDLDWSLADVVVLRRGQLRLFVDTGRVEDRRESLYRVSDFAVGVGVGFAAFYDFLGFHPAVAYIAIAQRVDRVSDDGVQFLFGTRQAF